jgi:uncharacterized protein (DUF58 family)
VGSALLWAYIAAGLVALGAYAQTAPKLSITLKRVQSNTAGDRSVQVRIEVRNISQSNVALMVAAPQTDFTLSVIGPDGRKAPATQLGTKLRSVVPNGSHVMITLPPQETSSRTWTLSDLVDFSKSGRYRVTVSQHFDNINETDTSNSIDIDIP